MRKGKRVKLAVLAIVILAPLPLGVAWLTAPADPIYNGVRLSTHLYRTYESAVLGIGTTGQQTPLQQDCHDALKHLGPKAAPLLTAWIENRPSNLRDSFRNFLRRQKINWPYFTANHQDIVERLFFNAPEAAVPLADAFQWQILNGESRDATRSASLLMFVINSVDATSRKTIASRSGPFVVALLEQFELEGNDVYSLCLVGAILKNHPDHITPELRQRVLALSRRSRYLESAAALLKEVDNKSDKDTRSAGNVTAKTGR